MVSKFILTDAARKNPEGQVSPAAFFRLALSQEPEIPFFPSLSNLVIIDANASLSYLELFLTPSLKSLEVLRIPDAQQTTLFAFLVSLAEKALELQTFILGPGRFPPSSLQIIPQFNSLCHLELKNEDPNLPLAFFETIGSLPKLETLILDARHVSSIVSINQSNSMEKPTIPPNPDNFPDANSMDGKSNEDGAANVLLSQTISTSGTFNQLSKLHVVGWLPLLEDLIPRIMSTRLEDISVTLIRFSYDEVWAKAEEEEERKRQKRQREAGKLGRQSTLTTLKSNEELKSLTNLSFDAHTVSFTELLRLLFHRWTISLKIVSVCQLSGSFQCLLKPSTLPEEIFQKLLLLPAIESLEVKGWGLNSVESVLNVTESIPNLKSLLLPLGRINSGISLPTLRRVAEICPKLELFQCNIQSLALIPEYTVPTTETLFHGLRTLSIGNLCPHPDSKKLYLIARHLDLLFPHLEKITTSEGHNAEQWVVVDELVKMCQTARMDERYRLSLTSGR